MNIEEKEVNGWKYYRNPEHGLMVAYYKDVEQIIFENDEAFFRWLECEFEETGQ